MKLILFLILAFGNGVFAETISELPPDVPRIRWNPDVLYTEEGFRLGFIENFNADWWWHYEGHLMLGFYTDSQKIMDKDCVSRETEAAKSMHNPQVKARALAAVDNDCMIDETPWPFSTVNYKLYRKFGMSKGAPVVVYYTKEINREVGALANFSAPALWTDTVNYVKNIWAVNPTLKTPGFEEDSGAVSRTIDNINASQAGFSIGHIVKATMDHHLFKTYEVTMQETKGGSNFKRFSVNDSALFDHIVLAMLTGKEVKVAYTELPSWEATVFSVVRGYSTAFRISDVEIVDPKESGAN